jgi:thiamine-phosphate pyrophosphorylase
MKDRSSGEMLAAAKALRSITQQAGATLIINDRVDIALAAAADGVHLGAEDLPIEDARRLVGPAMLLGRSTHSLDEAVAAVSAGADYVGFGPIFPTLTKALPHAPQGLDRLRDVCARIAVPIVAIGGITDATAPAVRAAGASATAMISELARAPDIEEKVRRLLTVLG